MTKVVHIVPHAPPQVCGIGDYAWRLGQAMQEHDGRISCRYFEAGTTSAIPTRLEKDEPSFPELAKLQGSARQQQFLNAAGKHEAVILHVSPYGYQKRGVPFWLSAALQRLSRQNTRPLVIAMFHELYASGPVTASSFWLQPLQKLVLRRIAKAADILHTNRENYAAWLNKATHSPREAIVMPVFSNLGELDVPPQLMDRPPAMVVFTSGMHGGGGEVIKAAIELCRRFHLGTLHLIGGPPPADDMVDGIQVIHHGFLSESEASSLLSRCRMAYTRYNPLYLGKSGIFAACAAHGLAVVVQARGRSLPDGLRHNNEVLCEYALQPDHLPKWTDLQQVASQLHSWYAPHSITRQAETYNRHLRGN